MYQLNIKIYILGDALDPIDNERITIYDNLLKQLFINDRLQIPQLDIYNSPTYDLLQNEYMDINSCFYKYNYNENIEKLLKSLLARHEISENRYNDLFKNYLNTYNMVFNYYNSLCYLTNLFIYKFFENKENEYNDEHLNIKKINKFYIQGNHDINNNYIISKFNLKDTIEINKKVYQIPLKIISNTEFYNRLNMRTFMKIDNKFYISHAGYIFINDNPLFINTLYTTLRMALISSDKTKLNNLLSVNLYRNKSINILIPFQIIGHTRTLTLGSDLKDSKYKEVKTRIDKLRKLFLESTFNGNNINIKSCDLLNTFYNNYFINDNSIYYIEYINGNNYITLNQNNNNYNYTNENNTKIINIESNKIERIGGNLIKSNNNLQIQNHINNIKKYFDNINNLLFVNLLSIIDYEFFILLLARICYDVKFLNNLINNNNKSLLFENKNILKNEIKNIEHLFVTSKKDRLINNLSKNNSKKIYVGGLLDNIMKNKIIQFNNKEDVINYLIQLYNITDNDIINNLNELVNLLNKINNDKLKMMLLNIFNNEEEDNEKEGLLSKFSKLFL